MKKRGFFARTALGVAIVVALGLVSAAWGEEASPEEAEQPEPRVAEEQAERNGIEGLEAQLAEIERALAQLEDEEPSPQREARMSELRARGEALRARLKEAHRERGPRVERLEERLGEVEEEIERLEGEEPSPERDSRLEKLRATARELRAGIERWRSDRGPRELEARRRELEEKIREIKRRIAEWESEPPSPERDRRLEELRNAARDVAGALEELVERGRAMWRERKKRGERPLHLEIFGLEHADAGRVAEIIEAFLPRESRIAFDDRTNKVVVLTTERGLEYAARIVEALDVPMPREGKARYVPEPEPLRREGPRFDYERREETGFREKERRSFQRLTGVVVEVTDETLTVRPNDAEEPITFQIPKVREDGNEWRVPRRLQRALRDVEPGKRVVVAWWEADDVRYLEDIVLAKWKRDRDDEETYLFRR